jgi:hypothetical protein
MKKSLLYTHGLLILLTISTALVSSSIKVSILAVSLIMGLSVFKFMLVAFQFMELRKANSFWKLTLGILLGLIVLLIVTII